MGHASLHIFTRRERSARIPRAVHGFSEDRVGLIGFWLDDHIIGFGNRNPEFIRFDRPHIEAVGGDDCHAGAAALGALPGCGGAIIVVTQYVTGRLSFGSVVAVLTATMGVY